MPALVKSSVGSLAGTSDDECTRLWPLLSKKRRNFSRISDPVGIVFYFKRTFKKNLNTEERRKRRNVEWIARIANSQISPKSVNPAANFANEHEFFLNSRLS